MVTALAKNQFVIINGNEELFQSYNSVIAKKTNNKIYLDENLWNYSKTTSKYRCIFLGEKTKETEKKIENGTYILTNLN
jgi:hypothetical protein